MTDTANASDFDLRAEIARLDRDREYRWFPWLQLGLTTIAAIAATVAAIVAHMK